MTRNDLAQVRALRALQSIRRELGPIIITSSLRPGEAMTRNDLAQVRAVLGFPDWLGAPMPVPQTVVAHTLDIGARSVTRYETERAPEWYRWALIGLMAFDEGYRPPVPGLAPTRPEALPLESWRREMKEAARRAR